MDIERFSPHRTPFSTIIIAPLPTTIELTGFSDYRHFLEQQETIKHGVFSQSLDFQPLDSFNPPLIEQLSM